MEFLIIIVLVLLAGLFTGQSHEQEKKLETIPQDQPIEGIKTGVKAMTFTICAALFCILAFFVLAISMLPNG